MSEKFCNILVHISLHHICHMTEPVKVMRGTHCTQLYSDNWCVDTLCLASSCVLFESHTDGYTKESNLQTYAVQVQNEP